MDFSPNDSFTRSIPRHDQYPLRSTRTVLGTSIHTLDLSPSHFGSFGNRADSSTGPLSVHAVQATTRAQDQPRRLVALTGSPRWLDSIRERSAETSRFNI